MEIIAAMSRGEAGLTKRLEDLEAAVEDLVRQIGLQKRDLDKQLSDLRAVVAEASQQTKQKPVVARTMADIRRFTGDDE